MINSVEKMIEQYISAWNEKSYEGYKREFEKCWAADGIYSDPTFEKITGVDGITAFASKSFEIVPERIFTIFEKADYHHNTGRYAWKVEVGERTNIGYDYFEFNEDFKITKLISFF